MCIGGEEGGRREGGREGGIEEGWKGEGRKKEGGVFVGREGWEETLCMNVLVLQSPGSSGS